MKCFPFIGHFKSLPIFKSGLYLNFILLLDPQQIHCTQALILSAALFEVAPNVQGCGKKQLQVYDDFFKLISHFLDVSKCLHYEDLFLNGSEYVCILSTAIFSDFAYYW